MSFVRSSSVPRDLPSFPTRRSSDLIESLWRYFNDTKILNLDTLETLWRSRLKPRRLSSSERARRSPSIIVQDVSATFRSEEHTSELQSQSNLVCRLLLEKKKTHKPI